MSGTTTNGIEWMLQAKTARGFFTGADLHTDQIFVMTCYVPAAAISDGKITVILMSTLDEETYRESIGYDNFRVTGCKHCSTLP